jgi:hypothetical protein
MLLLAGLVFVAGDGRDRPANASAAGAERTSAPRDEPRTIRAFFEERSYAPGERATLVVYAAVPTVEATILHAGPEGARVIRKDVLTGVPVTTTRTLNVARGHRFRLAIGGWPSGLYFARLEARDGYLGFAPVVVRPDPSSAEKVAVVLPTNTWQAYNFRDGDGDGVGDTWYADPHVPCVHLARPYLDRGVPSVRIRGFLRWFEHGGRRADFLSDDDLDRFTRGDDLARRYDLILFASHEEYVTEHVYDLVTRFRDLGGNLAFLSANTFFYRVARRGDRICRTGLWKDLGRVDARLTGVHYLGWWEHRYPSREYVVRGARRAPWLFEGTGLRDGNGTGGRYGVEIDMVTKDSPRGTTVLADIPDQFGPGRTATMAYYETRAGARVFAAGAMGFESPQTPVHKQLLDNVWRRLTRP